MKIRMLDRAAVRELLPMDRCISLMRQALALVARKEAIQPVRMGVRPPGVPGLLGLMPGYIGAPPSLGVKVLTVFDSTTSAPHGSHQGFVLLFETQTGAPRAIIDAEEITAIRTAATTAAATDVLARPDASTVGLFGYGEQARRHLSSLSLVRTVQRVMVWGRDSRKAQKFAEEQAALSGLPIQAVDRPELVASADILCTTTSASEPYLRGEWLRAGQHVNLVGASMAHAAEADIEVVRRSRYFGDYREGISAQAGEWLRAREAGVVGDDHLLGCVGDVLEGICPGRRSPADITVFKSLGMIVEDLVAANFVLTQAERSGAGTLVDW